MSKQNNQSQDMDVRTPKEKFKMEKNASSSSKTKTQLQTEEMTVGLVISELHNFVDIVCCYLGYFGTKVDPLERNIV